MTIHSIADIAGGSATVPLLATVGTRARRIFLGVVGSGTVRVGDANVTSSRGVAVVAATPLTISVSDADETDLIDLNTVNAYVPSGTTLTVSYTQ